MGVREVINELVWILGSYYRDKNLEFKCLDLNINFEWFWESDLIFLCIIFYICEMGLVN